MSSVGECPLTALHLALDNGVQCSKDNGDSVAVGSGGGSMTY